MDSPLYAVVMAGGSGTRFWPASRTVRPKQFLRVVGDDSLLQATVARLAPLVPIERVLVIGARRHVALVREQLPNLPEENVLGEPCPRGTLPCAAWAAAEIGRRDANAVMALLPADHVIAPSEDFRNALQRAAEVAAAEPLPVVFGIRPTFPATGFGYIQLGEPAGAARRLERFVEKPDEERAIEFLASGDYAWNGGVFVWSVATIRALLERHAPESLAPFDSGPPSDEAFAALEDDSIDVALMERVEEARVVEAEFTWSDVGSWNAMAEVLDADADGNHVAGGTGVVSVDSKNCIVHGPQEGVTALVGVENLVVARDGDAVLVMHRDRDQDVRQVVARLRAERPDAL